jgi:hypothetical protein
MNNINNKENTVIRETWNEFDNEIHELLWCMDFHILENNNEYRFLFSTPSNSVYSNLIETFYKIWDFIICIQDCYNKIEEKKQSVRYRIKCPSKVWNIIENDSYLKSLLVSSKWKIKSSEFIKLYKSLLSLNITKNEIYDYFNLNKDYNDFIKNFL